MNNRRLTRSSNKMIGGVCSGLAEYLGWDPTAVRVAWVLLTFFTVFSGVVVYLIFWLIMPED